MPAGRCPECGLQIDENVLMGRASIPWQHRARVGRVRGFLRTIWLAIRHPRRLAHQAARDVDYLSARRFQLICCLLAFIAYAVPVSVGFWAMRTGIVASPPWGDVLGGWEEVAGVASSALAPLLADAALFTAGLLGIFLWLLLGSGVASYFFYVRDRAPQLNDRAISLSYYAAAPLALAPLVVGLWAATIFSGEWLDPDPGDATFFIVMALLILAIIVSVVMLVDTWLLPARLLRQTPGHASAARQLLCALITLVGWVVLFVLLVIGLPALVLYAQVVFHALSFE